MTRYILLWPYIMVESFNLTQPLPPGFGVSDPPHWKVQLCQLLPSDASSQGPSNHQWEGLAPQTPGQADGKVDGSSEGFSFIYIAPQILSIGCFGRFSNCKKTDGLNLLGLGFFSSWDSSTSLLPLSLTTTRYSSAPSYKFFLSKKHV